MYIFSKQVELMSQNYTAAVKLANKISELSRLKNDT